MVGRPSGSAPPGSGSSRDIGYRRGVPPPERNTATRSERKKSQVKQEDRAMQIKDRIFIVTGASSGIGMSTAHTLSDRGAKVALLARSADALKVLAQQLPGSLPVTADMTQFDRVRDAVHDVHRHFGRVDGLVNNAGRSYAAAVEEIDPALFDEIFHLNVLGPIVAMQA